MNSNISVAAIEVNNKLTFSDKLIGILTEPVKTFERLSSHKKSTLNWVIPLLIFIITASAANYLMLNNPIIKDQAVEKQMDIIKANFQNAVASGQITQEQADLQIASLRDKLFEQIESSAITSTIGIFIVTLLFFFIVSGIFYLISKYILKGKGEYSSAMNAYGMAYYILIFQVVIMLIIALSTDNLINNTSLGLLISSGTKELGGFLLSKVDPFSIWFYSIVSIALAKMFGSKTLGKYFAMVFSLWIGFNLVIFFLSKQIPLLQMFIQ